MNQILTLIAARLSATLVASTDEFDPLNLSACPIFPGQVNRHHWPFYDPAHATGTEEEKLSVFRRVRDEIRRVFTAYADGRRDAFKAKA